MFSKRYAPVGSRPGTLHIDDTLPEPEISVFHYDVSSVHQRKISNADLLADSEVYKELQAQLADPKTIVWIDVQGLGNEKILLRISELLGLHALTMADIVNAPQRAKSDPHESYILNISSMPKSLTDGSIELEQLSTIWSKGFVVTFQERLGDVLEPVRERLRQGVGQIRKTGADYLAYAIIDTSVDAFYPLLEDMGEYLASLEDRIVIEASTEILQEVYRVKRELMKLRRTVWPQREAVSALLKEENQFVKKATTIYFRDTYEHLIQIIEVVENYRELAASLVDIYLSSLSNKMNEVMKVLSIIGTIFIPLSFIAGVFGMNFEYMPELKWKWSYPLFWLAISSLASLMIYFFYRKGWIGSRNS